MNRFQTLRIVLLMLLLAAASVAAYLFFRHELYFCLLFSLLIVLGIILYVCQWQQKTTLMVARMIEGIRYSDFSLSFSVRHKSRSEQLLAEEINKVVSEFRTKLSEKEERYQYYETLLNTVDSSLLVADSSGMVHWMNCAAVHDLCGYPIHSLNELSSLNSSFPVIITSLQPGEVKEVRICRGDVMQELAVTVTEYSSQGVDLRLINLKNIHSVLERNEMEAWQKLIRVLTHEIMNSITPIISLSETLSERGIPESLGEKEYSAMLQAMQTIHRRSKGLLGFVENYRRLTRIPIPVRTKVSVAELFMDLKKLFPEEYIHFEMPASDLFLYVDRAQIEQVLINLLKNARETCERKIDKEIQIKFFSKDNPTLTISDNGEGILTDVLDKIFVPFFTTKTSGSGIGLSLCKQIMTLHDGSINVKSEIGKGSCFILTFPK